MVTASIKVKVRECPHCGSTNEDWGWICTKCEQGLSQTAPIQTPQVEFESIGFWRRLAAHLVDWSILESVPIIVALATHEPLFCALGIPVSILYFVAFWAWVGQTPGMMTLGMVIVANDKGPDDSVGFKRAFVRYIGSQLSIALLGIGFLMIAWDGTKQGLHDKLAGTYVIKDYHSHVTRLKDLNSPRNDQDALIPRWPAPSW